MYSWDNINHPLTNWGLGGMKHDLSEEPMISCNILRKEVPLIIVHSVLTSFRLFMEACNRFFTLHASCCSS